MPSNGRVVVTCNGCATFSDRRDSCEVQVCGYAREKLEGQAEMLLRSQIPGQPYLGNTSTPSSRKNGDGPKESVREVRGEAWQFITIRGKRSRRHSILLETNEDRQTVATKENSIQLEVSN